MKFFICVLKTRGEMERSIPTQNLGWWHDCIPGQVLKLREATEADISKSWLRKGASTKPEDYLVHESGLLISKKAIKQINNFQESA